MIVIKSVIIKDKKEFEVLDTREPISDGSNVIIEVLRAGICGSDIHNWVNGSPVGLVLGHEYAGIVRDNGSRSDLSIGDIVTSLPISPCGECRACNTGNPQYCAHTWDNALGLSLSSQGAYSRFISVDPQSVIKVPSNISLEEVSMIEPTAVGLHAVSLANIKIGNKVLVVGGGIIGLICAMFARKEGASGVVISETNKKRGQNAVQLGLVDECLDAKSENFMNDVLRVSDGGFDVVLECSGNSEAVTSAIMACRPGGKVVLVGVATDSIKIPSVLAVLKELSIQGAIAYTKEEFLLCADLMSKREIDVSRFVSDIISLDQVQNAFLELTRGDSDKIKILIDPKLI